MQFWVDFSQIVGVGALIVAICVGIYYSSQIKKHNSLLTERDEGAERREEGRVRREEEEAHHKALRAHERRCAWSVDLTIRWLSRSGRWSLLPFEPTPRRPAHWNDQSTEFYFGATCAHIGRSHSEALSRELDDVNPDSVEALRNAMAAFGLREMTSRPDFLQHVYLSALMPGQPGLDAVARAALVSPSDRKQYRFALHLPSELAAANRPPDVDEQHSVVWVHRIDVDVR